MNVIKSIPFSNLAENSFLSNLFSSSATDKKIIIVAVVAFALYMCFCTCHYFYYNWKKMEDGPGKTVDFLGLVHEGEFKDGELNGQGIREMLFGVATGEFKDGKLNGQGSIIENGVIKVELSGEFKDHNLNGQGKCVESIKKYLFFGPLVSKTEEGQFKDGLLHGKGKKTYMSGRVEEGTFVKGQFVE